MQYRCLTVQLKLVWLVLLFTSTAVCEAIKTSEECFSTPYRPLHLTCGSGHRIHVISITYQNSTRDCQPLVDGCEVVQLSRWHGFSTTCNGQRACLEPVQDFWITEKCGNISFIKFSISYQCISENSIIDVCNTTTAWSPVGLLYLASPNFDNPTSLGPGRPCVCNVTGQEMSLEILEVYLRLIEGARANLTLTTKTKVWSSGLHGPVHYNNIVLRSMSGFAIDFNTLRRFGQMMWIRINGSSQIQVSCNGGSNDTVFLPEEPSNSVGDSSTSSVTGGNNNTLTIVAITCGVIILLLFVIIILLVVYLKVRGSQKWRSTYDISRYDPTDISYIHYDEGSVATEYDTAVGQQIPTEANHHCDGGHHYNHLNEYSVPHKVTSEPEADGQLYESG